MRFNTQRKALVNKLKKVIDPEIGIDIVELGLIYNIDITPNNKVEIQMTLTTPGCPMHEYFLSEIETVILDLEFVEDINTKFIWSPQWEVNMIKPETKTKLFNNN